MFRKIYLALLSLSVAVMAFFTYYAWSWLNSIGAPATAAAEFQYYSWLATTVLWTSTLVLMVLANSVLWSGKAWAIWTTFIFFTVFALLRYFGLEFAYVDFQMRTSPAGAGVLSGPVFGVILIVLMGIIAFFDQFIVLRLRAKTYGVPEETVVETVETPSE